MGASSLLDLGEGTADQVLEPRTLLLPLRPSLGYTFAMQLYPLSAAWVLHYTPWNLERLAMSASLL